METRFAQVKDIAVAILPEDELDDGNAIYFKEAIEPLLDIHSQWLIDLSDLRFIDSSGLGVLLSILHKVRDAGGDLKLCGLNESIRMIFEIVRMHRVFDIYDDQLDALAAYELKDAIAA